MPESLWDNFSASPPSAIGTTTTIFNIPLPSMPCSSSGLLPLILQNCVYKPHLPMSFMPHPFHAYKLGCPNIFIRALTKAPYYVIFSIYTCYFSVLSSTRLKTLVSNILDLWTSLVQLHNHKQIKLCKWRWDQLDAASDLLIIN
jgi:hypothetical protein